MFYISDRVCHKQTGEIGIVIGYGQGIVGGNRLKTIKVLLILAKIVKIGATKEYLAVKEDLYSQWLFCKEEEPNSLPNNLYCYAA